MRKVLFSLLMLALFVLLVFMIIQGVTVGNFHLGYSIEEILDKNDELDADIAGLGTKINTEYVATAADLSKSAAKLETEKGKYMDTVKYTTEEDIKQANVTEQYKIGYLWTKIGSYATKNYCKLNMAVTHGTSGVQNQYNLAFTAWGTYLDISNLIYDIEKDSELGFRIEEFNMIPYEGDTNLVNDKINDTKNEAVKEQRLQGSFMVKNVTLDPNSLIASSVPSSETDSKTSEDGSTTTNSTNAAPETGSSAGTTTSTSQKGS